MNKYKIFSNVLMYLAMTIVVVTAFIVAFNEDNSLLFLVWICCMCIIPLVYYMQMFNKKSKEKKENE